MKIDIKLFGQAKDYFPTSHFQIMSEKESLTVAEIKMKLISQALQPEKSRALIEDSALATEVRVLQNHEQITSGGVIFVLPPVCGG
ncbi:MoaD/ThiS family protein [Bdellovibrio sp.]|uniref:MoaD/ThiS family protein n=1 Tax=Bdellovibrio sp. TaxID=28201 RepID=UPI0039E5CE21